MGRYGNHQHYGNTVSNELIYITKTDEESQQIIKSRIWLFRNEIALHKSSRWSVPLQLKRPAETSAKYFLEIISKSTGNNKSSEIVI